MNNFTEYLLSFYGSGPDSIYHYGFTREQCEAATLLYKTTLAKQYPGQQFEGDSVDRERVRDIILATCYPELV
jgi:hypothetical protein